MCSPTLAGTIILGYYYLWEHVLTNFRVIMTSFRELLSLRALMMTSGMKLQKKRESNTIGKLSYVARLNLCGLFQKQKQKKERALVIAFHDRQSTAGPPAVGGERRVPGQCWTSARTWGHPRPSRSRRRSPPPSCRLGTRTVRPQFRPMPCTPRKANHVTGGERDIVSANKRRQRPACLRGRYLLGVTMRM